MPRLDLLLAHNTGLSRKGATRALRAGRVRTASGEVLQDAKLQIEPASLPLSIVLDDEPVMLRDRYHLLLHKPVGVVTALRDERHPTARELIAGAPLASDLRAVGRLDLDTSGLLLWTTDGTLLHRLTHPRYRIPRTYEAALARVPGAVPSDLTLEDGHRPEILALDPLDAADAHPALMAPDETAARARITIVGGKYHEVRRIFAALGSHVLALCRVAYGELRLPADLPAGSFVEVDPAPLVHGRHPTPNEP